jgi:fermentation-respiration switch protein FrsA (DUF1100 family)
MKLDISVALAPGSEGKPASGTIDVPMQSVKAAALSDVIISSEELKFTLVIPGAPGSGRGVFELKLAADGASATGELHQSGASVPVRLERIPEGAPVDSGPKRLQEPKGPFPYSRREVSYTNAKDGTKLAATLTIPEGPGPFPAVVMITGSGAQDRDETIFLHKPFLVIADHLTRHGIAVLRADDRGVGGSTGSVSDATAEDSVGDALAGIACLKGVPEIDKARIGLIGHSEGGIIAPKAAAASHDVAFIVMLAGTGLKGGDILTMQSEAIMLASGVNKDLVARATEQHKWLMDLLERSAPRAEIAGAIRELAITQRQGEPGAQPYTDAQLEALVGQQISELDSKWFRSFLSYDPREALRRVKAPVLALNGSLDTQVPAKANLAEIEKALKEAGNTDFAVRELPGLNHLFQTAKTGGPDEYMRIEETFSPEALRVITDWIVEHTRAGK